MARILSRHATARHISALAFTEPSARHPAGSPYNGVLLRRAVARTASTKSENGPWTRIPVGSSRFTGQRMAGERSERPAAWRARNGLTQPMAVIVALSLALLGDSLLYIVLPVNAEAFGIGLFWGGVLLAANRIVRIFMYGAITALGERGSVHRHVRSDPGLGAIARRATAVGTGVCRDRWRRWAMLPAIAPEQGRGSVSPMRWSRSARSSH